MEGRRPRPGETVKTKSVAAKIEVGDIVFIQWGLDEWKACKVRENYNGNLLVETSAGGKLLVENPKAIRFPAVDRGWG